MAGRSLATLFSTEPPDGTDLIVWANSEHRIVWRHDSLGDGDRRWFDQWGRDHGKPSTFTEILAGADDVRAVVRLDQGGKREAEKLFACVGWCDDAPPR